MSGIVGSAGSKSGIIGPVDITSLFAVQSGWSVSSGYTYIFAENGVVHLASYVTHGSSAPSGTSNIYLLSNTFYRPLADTVFPTVSYQTDAATRCMMGTNGYLTIMDANESAEGSGTHYVCINASYRHL